jgi:hypothetical protein
MQTLLSLSLSLCVCVSGDRIVITGDVDDTIVGSGSSCTSSVVIQ